MSGPAKYTAEALNPARHRRNEFSCESPELTEFLHQRARREAEARASACIVLVPERDPGQIAGYYTLSAATISLSQLPEKIARRLPRYPELPATLLGRLARDLRFRGQGLGELLLVSALRRAWVISGIIGSVAVITDPKDENAAAFYRRFGFRECDAEGKRLLLPMTEVERSLEQGETA